MQKGTLPRGIFEGKVMQRSKNITRINEQATQVCTKDGKEKLTAVTKVTMGGEHPKSSLNC